MAAQITNIIPQQNYEIIRDLIGVILAEELAAQDLLESNPLLLATIYLERGILFNKTELPAINILINGVGYDTKFRTESKGTVKYFIEIQTNKAHTSTKQGDEQSALDVELLAGKIRYILSHPAYTNLLNRSIVANTMIESIEIGRMQQNDAQHSTVARLEFNVTMVESNGEQAPTEVTGIDSDFRVEESTKGYKLIVNNI